MPGAAVTAFFLDSEDWSPLGLQVRVSHNVCVLSGVETRVASATVSLEIKSPKTDVSVESGVGVEIKT